MKKISLIVLSLISACIVLPAILRILALISIVVIIFKSMLKWI